jgi:hypothetical protein
VQHAGGLSKLSHSCYMAHRGYILWAREIIISSAFVPTASVLLVCKLNVVQFTLSTGYEHYLHNPEHSSTSLYH